MAHDSREATASAGLTPDAWSRVVFLEAPVCDGCGAAFEYDGGDFASDRCLACQVQPYAFARARAACVYDEASRGLILKFKHGDQQQFAPLFARWIARSAADVVVEADAGEQLGFAVPMLRSIEPADWEPALPALGDSRDPLAQAIHSRQLVQVGQGDSRRMLQVVDLQRIARALQQRAA